MFWGAPLLARELESGTYRLAWTQTVTRRRWLSVRVALVGVAALAVAGLASWLVSWWFAPLDAVNMNRFDPSVFTARGVVAIGYAGFAFALGVAAGALTRRTLPAMATTLLGFVAARIAVHALGPPAPPRKQARLVPADAGEGRRVRSGCRRASASSRARPRSRTPGRSRPRSSIAPTTPSAPRRCTSCSSAAARRSRRACRRTPAPAPARARRPDGRLPPLPARALASPAAAGRLPATKPLLATAGTRDRDLPGRGAGADRRHGLARRAARRAQASRRRAA